MSLILKLKKRICEAAILVFNFKFCGIDRIYIIFYGSISLLTVHMTPALPASVSFFFRNKKEESGSNKSEK